MLKSFDLLILNIIFTYKCYLKSINTFSHGHFDTITKADNGL